MNEKRIIDEIKSGNSNVFNDIYEEYYLKIYNYIFGKMDNKANTDDLVQIAFVKIYKNIKEYDEEKSSFYKFMLANCNQVIADYYAKKKRRNDIAETVELNEATLGEELMDLSELGSDQYNLKSAMSNLMHDQRKAFKLIYMKHLSIKEAAQKMGKTESSVKSLAFRARNVLKEEIAKKNPEVVKRYGFTGLLKLIAIAAICFALIGGFAYAMFRIYISHAKKETYTLEDVRREMPEEESEISRDEACTKINEYCKILGLNEEVSAKDLKLMKNYLTLNNCWCYSSESVIIKIDSTNGKLVVYSCLDKEKLLDETMTYAEIAEQLNLLEGYELYKDTSEAETRSVEYAKSYGGIFNPYQKVMLIIENSYIMTITVWDSEYEEKEVLINEEEAFAIAEENGMNVDSMELVIENIDFNESDKLNSIFDGTSFVEEIELLYIFSNVKKVWKVITTDYEIYYIDANNGNVYDLDLQKMN